jgi:predicted esterase
MWSEPQWFAKRDPELDYENSVRQVKELRRALDVLLAQPGVDPERIAYVGHDFGAMYGAVLSAIDRRPRAWALQAGTTSFSSWFLLGRKLDEAERERVVRRLAPLDPVRYIGEAAPSAVLTQFGTRDRFVPAQQARQFAAAIREPKRVLWYEAGHELCDQAAEDRIAWLRTQLRLVHGR